MVRREKEKTAVLILSAAIFTLCLFPDIGQNMGLYAGCPLGNRLAYSFFHANIFHAAINVWCLLSIVFIYNISWRYLLTAYCIAVSFPDVFLVATPTVGLSGICFALLGRIAFLAERKWYYQKWMAAILCIGFLLPGTAASLHLYCYVVGLLIAAINTPMSVFRKGGSHG